MKLIGFLTILCVVGYGIRYVAMKVFPNKTEELVKKVQDVAGETEAREKKERRMTPEN